MRDFREHMFEGAGQYLIKVVPDTFRKETSYLSTITYKVGYMHGHNSTTRGESNIYCLIAMSDGWIMDGYFTEEGNPGERVFKPFLNKKFLVDYLNDTTLSTSEYRFCTQEEITRIVLSQKGRWV